MTHRQIMEALSGLLLGLFVAILSSTVVSNALPRIIADLHGSQSAYTWVVTSTLLATTVSTPIWGKLADLTSKKLLVQLSLVIFILGSAAAGLSQNAGMLIACRVVQGLGAGGLTALAQVILASIIPPRERGRYNGYLGAVMALGTIGGPLLGGVIVDTSWLGWRWCFYVGVPFALAALVVLQRTLRLPLATRDVKVDFLGAVLVAASVSLLLIWVSLAGDNFGWWSGQTVAMVLAAAVLAVLFVLVELRASEPIIPMHFFRNTTLTLSVVASLAVGTAMFGATVFLSQYFQISRGDSPTMAGVMTLPMIIGLVASSTVVGRLITAFGKWKRYLIAGGVLLVAGLALMGSARADTAYGLLAVYMFLIGCGVGMTMQNLVLAVQNTVPMHELGAASSVVAFFRTLGGAIGVSALGAVLASKVSTYMADGLAELGVKASGGGSLPDIRTLPAPIAAVVEDSYGRATGVIFLLAAPIALVALLAILFIKEIPLRTAVGDTGAAQAVEGPERCEPLRAGAAATLDDAAAAGSGQDLPGEPTGEKPRGSR
ncbi:MDR family MFS transporter [Streptomyces carpinensis]|uniref:MDR family MFS transporter n=1 Tax=Streptomyces carpinensis TaxID=66369 RepID=A0ABV1W093_9ACTN|nr:MDR family MFS transporter [Streptomyces carpinensis]